MLVKACSALICLTASVLTGTVAVAGESPVRKERLDLTLVKKVNATTFDHKGRASGWLKGSVRSRITISHSVVLKGTATISTASGTLRLRIDGRARSLGLQAKFDGKSRIIGGSGRYRHARGRGTFTGVVNRSTWHATIDGIGTFTY